MEHHAEEWIKAWSERDRLKILACNPTIEDVIRDSQFYRLHYAISQSCRKAGAFVKTERYKPQYDYLADAIYEIEKSGLHPTLKRLRKWVEIDNPQQEFSKTVFRKAIENYRKKRFASKSTDKET